MLLLEEIQFFAWDFIINISIIIPLEFFESTFPDDISLESEWQQIFPSLQDSSRYSGRSQQCCSLDCLHLSSCFSVLLSLYQSFSDCTKSTNYHWYYRHFHIPQLFQFPGNVEIGILFFAFFHFYSMVSRYRKFHNFAGSLFFVDYYKVRLFDWD